MNYIEEIKSIIELPPTFDSMLEEINESAKDVHAVTNLFNKTQSQFMDNMMTVSHPTPFRNLRQVLAEMKMTSMALGETYFSMERKKIEIEELTDKLNNVSLTSFERRLVELDIAEKQWQIQQTLESVGGAIRKQVNYTHQFNLLKSQLPELSEVAFEEEEERYHIITAFTQALCSARSRGGAIDEGNQIYFSQIGINGTVAQVEMTNYLNNEAYLLSPVDENGNPKSIIEPTIADQVEWLNFMAEKFKGCSRILSSLKGTDITTPSALLENCIK